MGIRLSAALSLVHPVEKVLAAPDPFVIGDIYFTSFTSIDASV